MKMTDASVIVNEVAHEMLGLSDVDVVDSSNIVDIGKQMQSLSGGDVVYKKILDRIGKMIVRNKVYTGKFLNIVRDGWEFGNILQTLRIKSKNAIADPSYNPQSGQNYPLTEYEANEVIQKFYQDFDNFQLTYWRPNDQLWSAFNSMEELTRFFTGLEVAMSNSLSLRLQGLCKVALTNMIAQTLHAEFPEGNYKDDSKMKAVNLLFLYKATGAADAATMTPENCRQSQGFLRFAAETINNWYDRLQDMSTLFNIDGEEEFSRAEDINLVVLSTFANDMKYNLYNAAGQYDYSLMKLPGYETVPYWQGSGTAYDEGTIGEIHMTIKVGEETKNIEGTGIMAVMHDKEAVAVNCERKKMTTFYHPDLDQTKVFDKYLGQYINAFDKNFVVFYVA